MDLSLLRKLPTIADCVEATIKVGPTYGSSKQKDIVHQYSQHVGLLWERSFTSKHILTLKSIKDKLHNHFKTYRSSKSSWK